MNDQPSPATPIDVLLSQRFLPERGGSIRWMHEVYRRWPAPVRLATYATLFAFIVMTGWVERIEFIY